MAGPPVLFVVLLRRARRRRAGAARLRDAARAPGRRRVPGRAARRRARERPGRRAHVAIADAAAAARAPRTSPGIARPGAASIRALAARVRRRLGRAGGARAAPLDRGRAVAGRPSRPAARRGGCRAVVRAATPARERRRRRLARDRARPRPAARRSCTPASISSAFAPRAAARRPAARARPRRAGRLEAAGARARDRRATCRSCTSRSPARRCPATTATSRPTLRGRRADRRSTLAGPSTTSPPALARRPRPAALRRRGAVRHGPRRGARRGPAGRRARRRAARWRSSTDGAGRLYPPGDAAAAARSDPRSPRRPRRAGQRPPPRRGPLRRRSLRPAAWKRRSRRPQTMNYAAVIVLHRSRDELAAAARPRSRPPQLVVVDAGPDDGGAHSRAQHGATVIERRDNPGFGAANNLGARARHPAGHGPAEPGHATIAAQRPEPRAHAPTSPACTRRGLLNADGSVQRSAHPLPGTLGAFLPAVLPVLPRPSRARRALPGGHAAHRRVGDRRLPGRARPHARAPRPFDERHPPVRRGHGPLPASARDRACRTFLHPDLQLTHTGRHSVGDEPFELLAQQPPRRDRAPPGRARAALDDAAQLLTFATRATGQSAARERAQLDARLKRLRPGLARTCVRRPVA